MNYINRLAIKYLDLIILKMVLACGLIYTRKIEVNYFIIYNNYKIKKTREKLVVDKYGVNRAFHYILLLYILPCNLKFDLNWHFISELPLCLLILIASSN